MCLLVVCISRFPKKNSRYNSSICQRNARAVFQKKKNNPKLSFLPTSAKLQKIRGQLWGGKKKDVAKARASVFPLHRSSTARWQNLTDRRAAGAESPCCQAQIQEETLMLGNQHHNGVRRRTDQLSLSRPPPHPAPRRIIRLCLLR